MSLYAKAGKLLAKLYSMRRCDFNNMSVEDIIVNATPEEINFYYHWLCEVRYYV